MLDKIKELRAVTGLGITDCKKALVEAEGDMDKAMSLLKQRGVAIMEKKAGKSANQGVIESYVHFSRSVGALVEVNCQTDFVAKTEDFKKFAKDIAMHIAAMKPKYIAVEDINKEDLENVKNKEDFIKDNCLMEQVFVKDNSLKIKDYLNSIIAKTGEKVVIKRFARFSLGDEKD